MDKAQFDRQDQLVIVKTAALKYILPYLPETLQTYVLAETREPLGALMWSEEDILMRYDAVREAFYGTEYDPESVPEAYREEYEAYEKVRVARVLENFTIPNEDQAISDVHVQIDAAIWEILRDEFREELTVQPR